MSRQRFRASDIKAALNAMKAVGVLPKALDVLPDGTMRWHFQEIGVSEDDELDRELAEFEAKHAMGR